MHASFRLSLLSVIALLLGLAVAPVAAQDTDELIARSRAAALTLDEIGGEWTFKQDQSQVVIRDVLGYYGSFYERDPVTSLRDSGPCT